MKIVVYKRISERLKKPVKQFDRDCFPWIYETKKRISEHQDKFSPSVKDQFSHFCALENNNLIGRVIVMKRKIKFANRPVILGGIAGVCVCPEKRKKGLATKLLKRAMAELKKTGCDIAYLCTDAGNQGFLKLYGQVGFTVLGRPQTYSGKSGKRYIDNDAMIAPVNSLTIFKQVLIAKEPLDIGAGNW
ncbi:MAG: GNAT family N-acetyltransferase [Patescibacteria group bacterium]|nr:GNAT family N-acetyltransferase [Patescibacteria group bacterium]